MTQFRALLIILLLFVSTYFLFISKKKPPQGLLLGATFTVSKHSAENEAVLHKLVKRFRYVTSRNSFKQSVVHKKPAHFNWDRAEKWMNSIEHADVRLHAPVGPQSSKWAKKDSRTKEELVKVANQYTRLLCQKASQWSTVKWVDVVNETVSTDATWFGPKAGTDLWENPWLKIGIKKINQKKFPILSKDGVPTYILNAFKIASEECLSKKLIINQHGHLKVKTWDKIKELVLYLKSIGLKIDGIGWQGHIKAFEQKAAVSWNDKKNRSDKIKKLDSLIKWAHQNDLEFHITELDFYEKTSSEYNEKLYSQILLDIVKTLNKNSSTGFVSLNLWTLFDQKHHKNESIKIFGIFKKNGDLKESMSFLKAYLIENTP